MLLGVLLGRQQQPRSFANAWGTIMHCCSVVPFGNFTSMVVVQLSLAAWRTAGFQGSWAVVLAAVAAVVLETLAIGDEASAATAVEDHLADALRSGQLDAGAAQALLQVDVLAPHQPAADGVDVVGGPELADARGDIARELLSRLLDRDMGGAPRSAVT